MAYKIQIINNALEVSDTVSGEILVSQPARDTWFAEEALDDGFAKFYGTTSTNEDNLKKYTYPQNYDKFQGFPIEECVDAADSALTELTFRNFCYSNLAFNRASGSGALSDFIGFVDYNDSTGEIDLVADTWTDVPNNGQGASTNTSFMPTGMTSLMDLNTGYYDFSQLTLGSDTFSRIDFTVTPNTNNASLQTRFVLGQGTGEYPLQVNERRLDKGSGIPYESDKSSFYIYMGDENTRGGVGKLQVKLSTTGKLINSGVAIKIFKR